MKERTAFECEFCGKIYKLKSSAARHERFCFANPSTKACRTCGHAEKGITEVSGYKVKYIFCNALGRDVACQGTESGLRYGCDRYVQGEKIY